MIGNKIYTIFVLFCIFQFCEPARELKFVYVTFRSGEHYPVRYHYLPENYPITDNGKNGNLTDLGIKAMFNVGKMLRNFYQKKICPIRKTTTMVTGGGDPKMLHSALLAYAGIMGKNESDYLDVSFSKEELMKYYNKTIAYVFQHPYVNCKNFQTKLDLAMISERSRWQNSYQANLQAMKHYYGENADSPMQLWNIYEAYLLQRSYDHTLQPDGIHFDHYKTLAMLQTVADRFPKALFETAELRRLGAGQILSHIIKDIERMQKNIYPKDARFTLYAGGAVDVAGQFAVFAGKTLRYEKPYKECTKSETGDLTRPDYGAMHIVEVYLEDKNKWTVRILYKNDHRTKLSTKRHVVKIKNCEIFCPVEKLKKLTKESYVTNEKYDKECGNPKIDWDSYTK